MGSRKNNNVQPYDSTGSSSKSKTQTIGWSGDFAQLQSETDAVLRAVGVGSPQPSADPLFVRRKGRCSYFRNSTQTLLTLFCQTGKRKKRQNSKIRRANSSTSSLRNTIKNEMSGGYKKQGDVTLSHSGSFRMPTQSENINRMTVEVLDTDSEASSHRSDDGDSGWGHEADTKDHSRLKVGAASRATLQYPQLCHNFAILELVWDEFLTLLKYTAYIRGPGCAPKSGGDVQSAARGGGIAGASLWRRGAACESGMCMFSISQAHS